MNTALDMFRSTLRSMFMIDSAEELDFGIYRIMRIKKQEIENWLNIRLEEDRQSVYKKKNNGLNFNKIVMFIVFALVLAITIFSMLK